jgi:anhydro-N-acetylmuramic acid kinase
MSGTSLDGLDICYAVFRRSAASDGKYSGKYSWEYSMIAAEDSPYPQDLREKLAGAHLLGASDYARLNSDYGLYIGKKVHDFIIRNNADPHFIASHGQTIFHQPEVKFTAQIGSGAGIAAETGVDTICDFRTSDVALGGQGAPLVPIGDELLFPSYDYCLNLGGFSNVSFRQPDGKRTAYDICPVNFMLNKYMRSTGEEFDRDGNMARSGKVCDVLLDGLNSYKYYSAPAPKSLGREWVERYVFPYCDSYSVYSHLGIADIMATLTEHAAVQIAANIKNGRVLVTGGGAFNKYLIERLSALAPEADFIIPDKLTVSYKEALIFAFLGVLYVVDTSNCLASVTGASRDNIGGALYKAGNNLL